MSGRADEDGVTRRHTREDSGLRLDRELRWWHDGAPIEHPKIVEAFNVGLAPAEDGRFILRFGADWCFVEVEDAAYAVLVVDVVPEGRLFVRLSDRTAEELDPATLELGPDGAVRCRVKAGRARARFSRDAQFALGELLEATEAGLSLRVGARLVPAPGLARPEE